MSRINNLDELNEMVARGGSRIAGNPLNPRMEAEARRLKGRLEAAKGESLPRAKGQVPRHSPGVMNKTEAEYATLILEPCKQGGTIIEYWFEEFTFKIADDCRYTPDFMVLHADLTIAFIEVKAEWADGQTMKDDARVKLKVAAQRYPFKFVLATKKSKKNGGGWNIKDDYR